VSAEYTYLYGTTSGFAKRFLAPGLESRLAQVGGFHIFHREDLRRIAPLWLEYTKKVRTFANTEPDTYFVESMHVTDDLDASAVEVRRKQARWHGEMYGYVFAAAIVGVTHRIRRDVMLYPGYEPHLGRAPMIMHYGAAYQLGKAYFNKMEHTKLKLETCPNFLFPDPQIESIGQLNKKDALSLEHLSMMNAAFCRFYADINCTYLPSRCGDADGSAFVEQIAAVQPVLERCFDDADGCAVWAKGGECEKNPMFMHSHCAVACSSCAKPIDEIAPDDVHLGDWKYQQRTTGMERARALAYIEGADEDELEELEHAVAVRKSDLEDRHKHEL